MENLNARKDEIKIVVEGVLNLSKVTTPIKGYTICPFCGVSSDIADDLDELVHFDDCAYIMAKILHPNLI